MKTEENNIDDILNDLDFKPITEGLGFHHSLREKKSVATDMNSQKASLERDMIKRVKSLQTEAQSIEKPLHMGELSAFYQTQTPISSSDLQVNENFDREEIQPSIMAPIHYRFIAWLVDMALLLTVMIFTVAMIILSTDLPMETLNVFMLTDELFVSFGSIFTMFYIFYFTLLDMTSFSTVGKKIMSIRVESNMSRLNLFQSFSKAIISIIGIPTLGLPSLLRLDNMLTSTYVSNR